MEELFLYFIMITASIFFCMVIWIMTLCIWILLRYASTLRQVRENNQKIELWENSKGVTVEYNLEKSKNYY